MMISTTIARMPHICRRWTYSKYRCTDTHQNEDVRLQLEKCSFTFMFFHQYFLFSLAALVSNWEAPACSASARSSRSDNFWSRSNTLSTLTRIISTTCTYSQLYFIIRFYLTELLVKNGPRYISHKHLRIPDLLVHTTSLFHWSTNLVLSIIYRQSGRVGRVVQTHVGPCRSYITLIIT